MGKSGLETAMEIMEHDALLREIFDKEDLDTEEGFSKLEEALKLAPKPIQILMGALFIEWGLPYSDEERMPVCSLSELAAGAGVSEEELRQLVKQLALWTPWRTPANGGEL
jgi:hypothetical protein